MKAGSVGPLVRTDRSRGLVPLLSSPCVWLAVAWLAAGVLLDLMAIGCVGVGGIAAWRWHARSPNVERRGTMHDGDCGTLTCPAGQHRFRRGMGALGCSHEDRNYLRCSWRTSSCLHPAGMCPRDTPGTRRCRRLTRNSPAGTASMRSDHLEQIPLDHPERTPRRHQKGSAAHSRCR